jgi:serine-type D-Ala-D-Ala carboxypeptidase
MPSGIFLVGMKSCFIVHWCVITTGFVGGVTGHAWVDRETFATEILANGVEQRIYPGAVAIVGTSTDVVFSTNVGFQTYDTTASDPTLLGTIFDLASLTKVLATTTSVGVLYQEGYLTLDTLIVDILGEDFGNSNRSIKSTMTVQHCLTHTAAPDPAPWYWDPSFGCPDPQEPPPLPPAAPLREDFRCISSVYSSLMNQPLDAVPGEVFLYSDLSFITLQFVVGKLALDLGLIDTSTDLCDVCIETASSTANSLAFNFSCAFEAFVRSRVLQPTMPSSRFLPDASLWPLVAPTLNDSVYTGGMPLQGQVSDGDAFAMGGIAGHAGLFAAVAEVARFSQALLATVGSETQVQSSIPSFPLNHTTAKLFTSVSNASLSSRALGWDTNLKNVSDFGFDGVCGAHASSSTFLHIGYSGTCICIDPLGRGHRVVSSRNSSGDLADSFSSGGSGFFSVILTNRIFGCQGQLCPSGSEDAVKSLYHRFNSVMNLGSDQH